MVLNIYVHLIINTKCSRSLYISNYLNKTTVFERANCKRARRERACRKRTSRKRARHERAICERARHERVRRERAALESRIFIIIRTFFFNATFINDKS